MSPLRLNKREFKMKLLLTVFIILFFLGCSHTQIEYLDAKNFIKESEQINKINSLYNHTYLGKSNSKIKPTEYLICAIFMQ